MSCGCKKKQQEVTPTPEPIQEPSNPQTNNNEEKQSENE